MFVIKKIYKTGGWTMQQLVTDLDKEVKSSSRKFSTKKLIEFLTNVKYTHIEKVNNLKNYKIEFWGEFDRLPPRYQYIQTSEFNIDEVLNFLKIWQKKQDFDLEIK